MSVDKLKLVMGRPILVDEKTNTHVYPPLIKDIVDMGEDNYMDVCLPFMITKDVVFGNLENIDELSSKYDLLELFFIKTGEDSRLLDKMFNGDAIQRLKDSLSYFLKTDEIRVLLRQNKIVVNNEYLIDNNEFLRLRKVIQSVCDRKDIEVEKPPENMTEKQRDIWEKLQKGRRRRAEKERIYLQDIINIVSFGGHSYIPKDKIDEMHYFELSSAYRNITQKSVYDTKVLYHISPKFDSKDSPEHWLEDFKIGK